MAGGLSLSLCRQVVTHITAEKRYRGSGLLGLAATSWRASTSGFFAGALHNLQSSSGNHVGINTPRPGLCMLKF